MRQHLTAAGVLRTCIEGKRTVLKPPFRELILDFGKKMLEEPTFEKTPLNERDIKSFKNVVYMSKLTRIGARGEGYSL